MKNGLLFVTRASSAVRSFNFVMLLYYCLVVTAGVLSGIIFWDIYKLMNPIPLVLPEVSASISSVRSVAVWNSWIDSTVSTPPVRRQPVKPKPAVKTDRQINLKINLVGIFGGVKHGVAIMSVDGQSQRIYVTGNLVKDDIRLSEVRLNSIVVTAEGVEKEYFMPKSDLVIEQLANDNLPTDVHTQSSALQPGSVINNQIDASTNQQTVVRRVVPQLTQKVRAKITSVKKQLQKKPASALSLGNFKLTRTQGQLGVQVKSFKYKDVMIGFGLQPNDIVISVNGKSVEEMTQNPQLVNELLQMNSFDIVVIRGGRKSMVTVKW